MSFWSDLIAKIVSNSDGRNTGSRENIKEYAFSCAMDSESCDTCKRMDGFSFPPAHVKKFRVPIRGCTSGDCRCQILPIFADEGVTYSIDEAGNKTVDDPKDEARKSEEYLEKTAPNRHAYDLMTRAIQSEKISVEDSILLYRDAIQAYKSALTLKLAGENARNSLGYCYDRITIILARLNRTQDAVSEIEDYRQFLNSTGDHSPSEVILKRELRLRKKLV